MSRLQLQIKKQVIYNKTSKSPSVLGLQKLVYLAPAYTLIDARWLSAGSVAPHHSARPDTILRFLPIARAAQSLPPILFVMQ